MADAMSVNELSPSIQIQQRLLFSSIRQAKLMGHPLPSWKESGFRVYSQNDEDGLLLWVFAIIGFTNRLLLDIAFGGPYGANSTNLLCHWGFTGVLVEANPTDAQHFFSSCGDTAIMAPKLVQEWVTAENINSIATSNGLPAEIDLFSLDVDGVDYWLWDALQAVKPRVVIVEAAAFMELSQSVTVPYSPKFQRTESNPDYHGASIPAFVKLAAKKGYRLVAANRFGFNLIFVRNDIEPKALPEIPMTECFYFNPPWLKAARQSRTQKLQGQPYVQI